MKLSFLGGADEVGASCCLIDIAGKVILVDAGIRISPRSSRGLQNSQLPDLQQISERGGPDFVLVTHAHTDHTGALPLVLEQYPQVPVLATAATQALTRVLQMDAQRIMKSKQEAEGELPLFDEVSVQRLLDAFRTVSFNQTIKLAEGLQVTYYTAGHIAGAALIALESSEGTLIISGDISKSAQRTVKSLETPPLKADALILESTYGGRLHANRVGEEKRLIATLQRVTERGGKVLIPAFALGRAQEVIQIILARGDELAVPVYVDGMVRTVCDAYQNFRDILPKSTVKQSRKEHLFFRGAIRPVRNRQERLEIVHRDQPMIVIASSGMLTGGASVVYAQRFAPDERNAILLTGYQDEEAPGRFLQRILQDRKQGQAPLLKFADKAVTVRCEIDTYSLSAHADEMELVSFAEALDAKDIMLVHGDGAARHSLATALRQRGRSVLTPRIGQNKVLSYAPRPWALGALPSGKAVGEVDLRQLWDSLSGRAGDTFSLRELSQIWWGASDRDGEMNEALQSDKNLYFSPDWRDKKAYKVKSAEEVRRTERRRAIMLANPDIVGRLIVMRNSNGQPRLAVVTGADIDNFTAIAHQQRGTQRPADALLWVIGEWKASDDQKSLRGSLAELMKQARQLKDQLLPIERRRALVGAGKALQPKSLLPATLPADMDVQVALCAIVLALAEDGATLEAEGLLPRRAMEQGPVEQNAARELALRSFPAQARLRKVGMDVPRKRLNLSFDFPATVATRYEDELRQLSERSGWEVVIKTTVNQQALAALAQELLPEGASIEKGPAIYLDKAQVRCQLANMERDAVAELQKQYRGITGFQLFVESASGAASSVPASATPAAGAAQLEINAAYDLIRARLQGCGLHKVGLKEGAIVLSFVSPQLGERHLDAIARLADEAGYPLSIHPHPNQHEILQIARRVLGEKGWQAVKGPGIHAGRGEVAVKLENEVAPHELEDARATLLGQTGFTLVVEA